MGSGQAVRHWVLYPTEFALLDFRGDPKLSQDRGFGGRSPAGKQKLAFLFAEERGRSELARDIPPPPLLNRDSRVNILTPHHWGVAKW